MIEFNETFDDLYQGKEALIQRITTRLKHTTHDIPYYDRGIDLAEFKYGSQVAAIKLGLRDFGAEITYDNKNNRVQYYDISIDTGLATE